MIEIADGKARMLGLFPGEGSIYDDLGWICESTWRYTYDLRVVDATIKYLDAHLWWTPVECCYWKGHEE